MKLSDALAFSKSLPYKSYVAMRGCWSEYYCQYFYDDGGKLNWTAGMSVGGLLTDADIKKHEMNSSSYWEVFRRFGVDSSEVAHENNSG